MGKIFTKEEFDAMKFDNVVGNPPYDKTVGPQKKEPIWQHFVEKSFSLTKDGGFVSLIHPSGWRSSTGRFTNAASLIKGSRIHYLSLNDGAAGKKMFNVGSDYDWYVCQKSYPHAETIISDVFGNNIRMDIRPLEFIPSGMFGEFSKLMAKGGIKKVDVLHSFSDYETRKKYMSKGISSVFKYPCVYSIGQKKEITCFYSSTKENGHFGIPKVIWSGGSGSYPIVDRTGEYGLTQFAFAIVAPVEDLDNIAKAMMHPEFVKIMSHCPKDMTNDKWSRKDLSTLRHDFWKDFI